ncbi:MAG TPA: FAD-dependent oxidoreductase [Pirellulaceae bacterium]|nr:FAD-dependent oxidoreductase [Pirellulaceae bacterium]
MSRFDALIIGGGPAGATAALLLAEAGWSVALVEQKAFPRRKVCGEYLSATNWPLLARLGIADAFADQAGPPVTNTAIFAGKREYRAALPRIAGSNSWGQALPREHLDTLLVARAASLGVAVLQPARCVKLTATTDGCLAIIESRPEGKASQIAAHVVIAAHGSWETGDLATQKQPAPPRGGDWLAFKAHFRQTNLPAGLMPMLCFAGGYGGMVHVGGERASLSCCIQRRRFERLSRPAGVSAGEAVLTHILESCPVLQPVLDGALVDGTWLSAGVIQPGIRPRFRDGVFVVGNAAGEAHPVVAEGISMAMQSAWLLAEELKPLRTKIDRGEVREHVARRYSTAWRRAFAPRIYAAAAIAQWASRPWLVQAAGPLLDAFPRLLTWGARLSGKSHVVVREAARLVTTEC